MLHLNAIEEAIYNADSNYEYEGFDIVGIEEEGPDVEYIAFLHDQAY
jgi:hypothetical protein